MLNIKNELGEFTVELGNGINAGDLYLAKRNTGWKLLECKYHDVVNQYVIPKSNDYCFDTHECYKVTACR